MKRSKSSGFTLIEVVVVMAVIAVLAIIALPPRIGLITQKRLVETIELVEPFKSSVSLFYSLSAGRFPKDNEEAGLPEPEQILGNFLQKVELQDGVFHLYLGQKLPKDLHGKIISIRPVYVDDSPESPISWVCGYSETPNGMVAKGKNLTDIDVSFLPIRCR